MTENTNNTWEKTIVLKDLLPSEWKTQYHKTLLDYMKKYDLTNIMTSVLGLYYEKYLWIINNLYTVQEFNIKDDDDNIKVKRLVINSSNALKINSHLAKVWNKKLWNIYKQITDNNYEYFEKNKEEFSNIFLYDKISAGSHYIKVENILLVKDKEDLNNSFITENIVKSIFSQNNWLSVIDYNINKLNSLWSWYETNALQTIDFMNRNNDPSVLDLQKVFSYEKKIYKLLVEELERSRHSVWSNRWTISYTIKATILYYVLEDMSKLSPDLYNTMFSAIYLAYKNIFIYNVKYYLTKKGSNTHHDVIGHFITGIINLSWEGKNNNNDIFHILKNNAEKVLWYNLVYSVLELFNPLLLWIFSNGMVYWTAKSTL